MSTRFTYALRYPAPLGDVAAMLADPAFRKEVCERQRVLRANVEIEEHVDGRTVVVERVHPTRGIPSFAQRLVGDEIGIVQREDWSGSAEAGLHATIPGKPGEVTGTIRLAESDGVTTETVDIDIEVRMPLVGRKIEGLVAELFRKALVAEEAVGRDYLSR